MTTLVLPSEILATYLQAQGVSAMPYALRPADVEIDFPTLPMCVLIDLPGGATNWPLQQSLIELRAYADASSDDWAQPPCVTFFGETVLPALTALKDEQSRDNQLYWGAPSSPQLVAIADTASLWFVRVVCAVNRGV